MKQISKIGIVLLASAICGMADPTFSIDGSSTVSGAPGSTVGWGYQITNDTGFYLLIDDSAFCGPGGDLLATACTAPYDGTSNFGPALGVYSDFIANNATEILPNSTATQAFDAGSLQGLGSYVISNTALPGATDPANPATQTSNIFISFMKFNGDPFNGGTQASGDIELNAAVQVDVTQSAPAVPEPATWAMMAGSLAGLAGWRRFRIRPQG